MESIKDQQIIKIGIVGNPQAIKERMSLWKETSFIKYLSFHTSILIDNLILNRDYFLVNDIDELIQHTDAIDLLNLGAEEAFSIFEKTVKAHKPIFFENPFILSIEKLKYGSILAKESKVICQPGLYLRFQEDIIEQSQKEFRFLESGISIEESKNLNYSDWLALVTNHVDLLSTLAHSPIKKIDSFALNLNKKANALLNFRIQFDNGAVGLCTINTQALVEEQVSLLFNEKEQKLIVWAKNDRLSHTFFDKNCIINALEHFIFTIKGQIAPKVTIFEALNNSELTLGIINQIGF
ncbi:MAG TPA: hypothetical protein VLZ83_07140 [Edaphocola sp.]|nr:hypothetical protein [Edaphocola sp.]